MKRLYFILFITIQYQAYSQYWEFGANLGGMNYHGDLAPEIKLKETKLSYGIFLQYNLNPFFTFKPKFNLGAISGNDANFKNNAHRNLSFKSRIVEISGMMDFNFLPFGSEILSQDFSAFITLGIAGYVFNPKAKFNNSWVALHNLNTEGQAQKNMYNRTQLSIPFGGGIKFNLTDNWQIGHEIVFRKTFTDYLDDVSTFYPDNVEQTARFGGTSARLSDRSGEINGGVNLSNKGDFRGDPTLKDWYFTSVFFISYRLTPIRCWPNKRTPIIYNPN